MQASTVYGDCGNAGGSSDRDCVTFGTAPADDLTENNRLSRPSRSREEQASARLESVYYALLFIGQSDARC